ncbi:MAG: hypothetical protein A2249_03065 [Candidatus Jacksonbacteria bacterium RIFOXYA2_FULL_44_7]|nr:MAG: hypothetical protein UW39_C0016G0022 [Parcubacteria group bacterium GW2011_GWC2_44_17]KKT48775.1 MAG: hypothetical protein UW40_C0033G0004 [Parcubacteria group bacterium GW2011_GWF2_44_17]OGY71095.1 MAG: hypothetical protein A3E05_00310 [Candidatus Jacksonbacteria bacterium RIFCSPHIGHO2_12_FULL_44_12]OGY71493.1 MAG: hypothetical protein A3C00_00740 [Candidatus Jacksonbacteria bacterium RIFCSPHIGHO2_02_FULL_44_25]OGY74944.1 MAG: hypothetical protein A3H07_01330 [Candidatus Jacksonbacteri
MADTPRPENTETMIEKLGKFREREIRDLLNRAEQAQDKKEWREMVGFLELVLSKLNSWDNRRDDITMQINKAVQLQKAA